MRDHSPEGHVVLRYDGELSQLHLMVLEMGGLVLSQLKDSINALKGLDAKRAQQIVETDRKVDLLEFEVDEKVLSLAALRSPVARDLRLVLMVSKCVTELEEAGDEVVNIARKIIQLHGDDGVQPPPKLLQGLISIGEYAVGMLSDAVKAYDLLEENPAARVIYEHPALEIRFQAELRRIVVFEVHDSRIVGQVVDIALIAKSLEAIGQHAKKIAEQVIFYIHGTDIRHEAH